MTERAKGDADPDATVMLPTGGRVVSPADDDATVMIPSSQVDEDATVMLPAAPAETDDTTAIRPASVPEDDATVMIPSLRDDDATVVMRAPEEDGPDPDATIAIPTPGRRREADAPVLPFAPPPGGANASIDVAMLGGLNPIVAAANPVLSVAVQIRHALKHPDPAALKRSLQEGVIAFEERAREAGYGDDDLRNASIALCALVDESAGSTPWGRGWMESGLLLGKHGEKSGAELFFDLLAAQTAKTDPNREVLEFFYVCLALGFEGRFRGSEHGRQELTTLRERLGTQLRSLRPPMDGGLSGNWRGLSVPARRPAGALGLWVAGCAASLLLAGTYVSYSVSLAGLSDPVARQLAQVKAPSSPAKPTAGSRPPEKPRIAAQLNSEIANGEVVVTESTGSSTIEIRSDRLFASGSARLESSVEPIVLRVAQALENIPGTIIVTGHTDDVPIRTARYPSNWELSTERATSVARLIGSKLSDASRLRTEGLADSAPIVPNDSAANRTRNRRVEIVLRSSP